MLISPNIFLSDWALLGVIILIGLFFWLVSYVSEARLKKTIQKVTDTSLYEPQFKCVVFSPGSQSCQFALAYSTKPILLSNLPNIPLNDCPAANCTCSLLQYDDRRTGIDRRDLEAADKRRKSVYANKRLLKDRRRSSIKGFLLPKYRTYSW